MNSPTGLPHIKEISDITTKYTSGGSQKTQNEIFKNDVMKNQDQNQIENDNAIKEENKNEDKNENVYEREYEYLNKIEDENEDRGDENKKLNRGTYKTSNRKKISKNNYSKNTPENFHYSSKIPFRNSDGNLQVQVPNSYPLEEIEIGDMCRVVDNNDGHENRFCYLNNQVTHVQ